MTKKLLHVGCGSQTIQGIYGFAGDADWAEVRFDIDERVKPDIVGTLTDMTAVESGSVDAVYSSHNIEHLYAHEVPGALAEFRRVLKDDGFVVLTCPDLQSVCEAIAADRLLEPLYMSPSGPISALDVLYGHRGFIAQGNTYMAHKCGFTYRVLDGLFIGAGFGACAGIRRPETFDMWIVAFKTERPEAEVREIAGRFIPPSRRPVRPPVEDQTAVENA